MGKDKQKQVTNTGGGDSQNRVALHENPQTPAGQADQSIFTTLFKFFWEHKLHLFILFLSISALAISRVLENKNPRNFNSSQPAQNCRKHFTQIHGNNRANVVALAENHNLNDVTWDCAEALGATKVYVEHVSRGHPVACEDYMYNIKQRSDSFKPVCVGWDIQDPGYYNKTFLQNAQEAALISIQQLRDKCYQEKMDGNQFGVALDELISKHKKNAKDFKKADVFSFAGVKYRLAMAILPELKSMQRQLNNGTTMQKIFEGYELKFSQPNYFKGDLVIDNPEEFSHEMLERGKSLVTAINDEIDHSKQDEMSVFMLGLCHVQACGPENEAAVRYVWNSLNKNPKTQNRFAVLAMLGEEMPTSSVEPPKPKHS